MAITQDVAVIEIKENLNKCTIIRTLSPDLRDTNIIHKVSYAFLPENSIQASFKSAFRHAFEQWSQVIPIDFIEHNRDFSTADIQIGFYSFSRQQCGCGATKMRTCSELGHAMVLDGRICMNSDYNWVVDLDADESTDAMDLKSTATHEIGHVLGLQHYENKSSVMYKKICRRERCCYLSEDDIIHVQKLYRPRPLLNEGP